MTSRDGTGVMGFNEGDLFVCEHYPGKPRITRNTCIPRVTKAKLLQQDTPTVLPSVQLMELEGCLKCERGKKMMEGGGDVSTAPRKRGRPRRSPVEYILPKKVGAAPERRVFMVEVDFRNFPRTYASIKELAEKLEDTPESIFRSLIDYELAGIEKIKERALAGQG